MDLKAKVNSFLKEVQNEAFAITRASINNTEESLDLVQEIMIEWTIRYAERNSRSWRPLFFRILQNRIKNWKRRERIERRIFQKVKQDSFSVSKEIFLKNSRGKEVSNPLFAIMESEERQQLFRAWQSLPPRQQEAFRLHIFEDRSIRETAETLGCAQGSVASHLARAKQTLKQIMNVSSFQSSP